MIIIKRVRICDELDCDVELFKEKVRLVIEDRILDLCDQHRDIALTNNGLLALKSIEHDVEKSDDEQDRISNKRPNSNGESKIGRVEIGTIAFIKQRGNGTMTSIDVMNYLEGKLGVDISRNDISTNLFNLMRKNVIRKDESNKFHLGARA